MSRSVAFHLACGFQASIARLASQVSWVVSRRRGRGPAGGVGASFLEVDEDGGEVGRVDAADAAGLADAARLDLLKFLAGFEAKLGDGRVVEVGREQLVFLAAVAFDLLGLPLDVAAVA